MEKKSKKKKLALFATVAVVTLVLVFVVAGLMRNNNLHQLALSNMAEARFYMKQGEAPQVRVQFTSGMREEPYNRDGIAQPNVPFALVYVQPVGDSLTGYTELNGTLRINGEDTPVTLTRNEFRLQNFGVDLERLVDRAAEVVFILNLTDTVLTIPLRDMMPQDAITWERALEIAVEGLYDEIRALGTFETYVKIISDRTNTAVFWYIQFLNREAQTVFAVISPAGELIGSTQ